ncbi:MAG: SBBP repeat-containing protein [Armatimonadetes bacterium]|nr:SBBP repeat-containing protein [Armatimonadota bacterium]
MLNLIKRGFRGAIYLTFVLTAFLVAAVSFGEKSAIQPNDAQAEKLRAARRSGFLENKGQWKKEARFLAQSKGVNVWFGDSAIRFDLRGPAAKNPKKGAGHAVDMSFVGARRGVKAVSSQPRNSRNDFMIGGKKSIRGARKYGSIDYVSLYDGIDLKWHDDNGMPRFDFIVAPGANPNQIQMRFTGANGVDTNFAGQLEVKTSIGTLYQTDLKAYQVVNGETKQIPATFRFVDDNTVGFVLGKYDTSRPLVIDPLVYGSYYGGDSGPDEVRSVVADTDKSVVMTGWTQAPDYPAIAGPFGYNILGARAMFVSKFQGDAYSHDYSCLVTGDGEDEGWFVSVSPDGQYIWLAGTTTSTNFPGIDGDSLFNTMAGTEDITLMRFKIDATELLIPDYSTYYGTANIETLRGLTVDPLNGEVSICGETDGGLPNMNNAMAGAANAFLTRFTVDSTGITGVKWGYYLGGDGPTLMRITSQVNPYDSHNRAIASDSTGNVIVVGWVGNEGENIDTALDSTVFETTAGVFANGRLLRYRDGFVKKYTPDGTLVFSTLLGGNDNDEATGVACDGADNIYITGLSRSFNFPRTRGVYGENFTAKELVFATKISADGATILYSTHLGTNAPVYPRGIAVDGSGNAYISGIVDYTHSFPFPPADPNEPNGTSTGNVPITGNPLDPTYAFPATPMLGTTEGFLLGLSPTASTLFYGTYLGGDLDEEVFAPYVDRFGDVWTVGSSDSLRFYRRVSSGGVIFNRIYPTSGPPYTLLPASLLSEFAFKTVGDQGVGDPWGVGGVWYGLKESPFTGPSTITVLAYQRDGFVVKQRLALPTITTMTLAPSSIAGGLGASTTGTVTLSAPVPAGGLDMTVELDNDAASFDPNVSQKVLTISLPGGATTATFTVYSNPVDFPTGVNVRATLIGNFMIRVLNVLPWLQDLTVTPNQVVGGNGLTGRVTLFQNAITDITIDLSTDASGLVDFPGGNTVTVPAGLDSITFTVGTHGVEFQTDVPVTATLLGVGKTNFVRLLSANLLRMTFNPTKVTSGAASTGTVFLDGEAGSAFTVDLSINAGTAGYVLNPTTLSFAKGEKSKDFTLTTAFEPINTQRIVTATRTAQGGYKAGSVSGTLFVDGSSLVSFTLDKTSVDPGEDVNGTVTVSVPANPGGTPVNMSSDSALVTVATPAVVPQGATSTTFPLTVAGQALTNDTTVHITAQRGPVVIIRDLVVKKANATITFNPATVIGGNPSTGTLSLTANAPSGGIVFNLSSGNAAVTVPATVTVPEGANSATFGATTTLVSGTVAVTVTGTSGGITAQGVLVVRAISVASLRFVPSRQKGGRSVQLIVTLDAPAPAGGAVIPLTSSNPIIANVPATITVPAGLTSAAKTVITNRVSRTLATQVQAAYGDEIVFAVLTVTR